MVDCPRCTHSMTHSEIESTLMRKVFRCYQCGTRKAKRSALSWAFLGGRMLLFLSAGLPPDPSDLLDTDLLDTDLIDSDQLD